MPIKSVYYIYHTRNGFAKKMAVSAFFYAFLAGTFSSAAGFGGISAQYEPKPAAWRAARFEMCIQWGLYSETAGTCNGTTTNVFGDLKSKIENAFLLVENSQPELVSQNLLEASVGRTIGTIELSGNWI